MAEAIKYLAFLPLAFLVLGIAVPLVEGEIPAANRPTPLPDDPKLVRI